MEVLRFQQDAFGQTMLVGMNWDWLWLPALAAVVVMALHQIRKMTRRTG